MDGNPFSFDIQGGTEMEQGEVDRILKRLMNLAPEVQLRALIPPAGRATLIFDAEAKEGQPTSATGKPLPHTIISRDHAYIHLVPGNRARLKMDVIHELLHWKFRQDPHTHLHWYLELLLDLLLFGRIAVPDEELPLVSLEDGETFDKALVQFGRVLGEERWKQEMAEHFGRINLPPQLTQERIDKVVSEEIAEDPEMRLFADAYFKERERLK